MASDTGGNRFDAGRAVDPGGSYREAGTAPGAFDAGGLARDDAFEVIRNERRRCAIHALARSGRPLSIGELADRVAAWENGVPREAVTSEERRRAYNALQQVHLPKLDDHGVVDHDPDAGRVAPTPRTDRLRSYLVAVPPRRFPWRIAALVIAAAFALGAALTAGAAPLPAVPPVVGVLVPAAAVGGAGLYRLATRPRTREAGPPFGTE